MAAHDRATHLAHPTHPTHTPHTPHTQSHGPSMALLLLPCPASSPRRPGRGRPRLLHPLPLAHPLLPVRRRLLPLGLCAATRREPHHTHRHQHARRGRHLYARAAPPRGGAPDQGEQRGRGTSIHPPNPPQPNPPNPPTHLRPRRNTRKTTTLLSSSRKTRPSMKPSKKPRTRPLPP